MKARVTIADLAKVAGVSKTAVSLALRNRREISVGLRQRIKTLAEDMGYRRDPCLSLIAASRWKGIQAPPGVVIAHITMPLVDREVEGVTDEFLRLKEYCGESGYLIEQFHLSEYRNARHLSKTLRGRGIRGVIISQIWDDNFCDQFEWEHFAAVAVNEGYYSPPVDLYTPNYTNTLCQCWQNLLARGYRRPAVVVMREHRDNFFNFIISSTAQSLQKATLPREERIPVQFTDPNKPEATRAWIEKYAPDVVIGFNDAQYWALRHSGYHIPSDLAFASMWRQPHDPGLIAGMMIDEKELIFQAASRVDSLLRVGQFGPPETTMTHRLNGKWTDGKSIAFGRHKQFSAANAKMTWVINRPNC